MRIALAVVLATTVAHAEPRGAIITVPRPPSVAADV